MSRMSAAQAIQRPKFALIAVLMFALLAAATGLAWLIVVSRTGLQRAGTELVERIHSEGLSAFWDRSPDVRWLIAYRDDDRAGWQLRMRMPRGDGGFEGLDAAFYQLRRRTRGHWEQWRLNADATTGVYRAGELQITPAGLRLPANTRIALGDGTVSAQQQLSGAPMWLDSEADAPDNYVPEGTLPLLRHLVAETGTTAAFRMVFNEQPPRQGKTSFGVITMERRELGETDFPEATARVVVRGTGAAGQQTFFLDERGGTVAVFGGEFRLVAVEREEVFDTFPQARQVAALLTARLVGRVPTSDGPPPAPLEILRSAVEAEREPATAPRTQTSIRGLEGGGE
jgi:hypothetical protein